MATKEYHQLWRKRHPEAVRLAKRRYRLRHPEQEKAANAEYYRTHPEMNRVKGHNYRARKRGLEKLTVAIFQQVYETNIKRHGILTCYLCLKPIGFGQDSLDHKTPPSRGGTHQFDNLDVAHESCNYKKQEKTEVEYRAIL